MASNWVGGEAGEVTGTDNTDRYVQQANEPRETKTLDTHRNMHAMHDTMPCCAHACARSRDRSPIAELPGSRFVLEMPHGILKEFAHGISVNLSLVQDISNHIPSIDPIYGSYLPMIKMFAQSERVQEQDLVRGRFHVACCDAVENRFRIEKEVQRDGVSCVVLNGE